MADHIIIERSGHAWAVKHNGSFLGLARSRDEAAVVAQDLAEWIAGRGRTPVVVGPEERSFGPPDVAPQSPSDARAAASAAASPAAE